MYVFSLSECVAKCTTRSCVIILREGASLSISCIFSIFNLGRNKLTELPEDRYSTTMRFGTKYHVSAKTLILAELEKDVEHPLRSKVGLEYLPYNSLAFRAGFATAPIELSFGFGWNISDKYNLDFGTQYHQILGWSPNFSFKYVIVK